VALRQSCAANATTTTSSSSTPLLLLQLAASLFFFQGCKLSPECEQLLDAAAAAAGAGAADVRVGGPRPWLLVLLLWLLLLLVVVVVVVLLLLQSIPGQLRLLQLQLHPRLRVTQAGIERRVRSPTQTPGAQAQLLLWRGRCRHALPTPRFPP